MLELVIDWVEVYVVRICQRISISLDMCSELVREKVELYLGGQRLSNIMVNCHVFDILTTCTYQHIMVFSVVSLMVIYH